jgi:hypothetical protein
MVEKMMQKKLTFLILFLTTFLGSFLNSRQVTIFKELLKPNRIYLDQKHIYVTERTTIFIYSLENYRLIKKFGTEGEGPNEFRIPLFIIPLKDRLLINSFGKISYYTKTGEMLKEVKSTSGDRNFYPLSEGFAGNNTKAEDNHLLFTVSLYNSKLETQKELYKQKIKVQKPGKIELFRRAFMHRTYKDRIYITGREGFVLDCLDKTGKTIYTIKREHFKKHKITPIDIKNAEKYFKIRYGDQYEQVRHQIVFPDYFPEIRAFYLADDKIYILPYEWNEVGLKFYIYSVEGKFLSEQYIPLVFKYSMQPFPFAIQDNKVYQLIENDTSEDWELHINDIKF